MAKWIQKMTSSPKFKEGALTAKADKAGMSPMAFARKNKDAGGLTGKQANAAINMQGGKSYCAGGKVLSSKHF